MEAVFSNLDQYWAGFKVTLELLAVGGLGALLLGIVIALLRISPIASLRAVAISYTELLRNTPLTLVFFLIIVVLPTLQLGFSNPKIGAFIALSMYTSAFVAEAIRSGINGVPIGQAEAARSVGLTFGQSLREVILPQAMRGAIAPLGNAAIALTKNTTVLATLSVAEMSNMMSYMLDQRIDLITQIFALMAGIFVLMTLPMGIFFTWWSKKMAVAR